MAHPYGTWTRARQLAACHAWYAIHGDRPRLCDFRAANGLPPPDRVYAVFGSLPALVAALGLPYVRQYNHQGSPGTRPQPEQPEDAGPASEAWDGAGPVPSLEQGLWTDSPAQPGVVACLRCGTPYQSPDTRRWRRHPHCRVPRPDGAWMRGVAYSG